MRNVGHKRLPEFIEEDYISAIETAISRCTYPRYFVEISRISQDEESTLGYDGVITTLVPFYIQFKRSTFHTPQFQGKTAKDRSACGFSNRYGFFSFTFHRNRNSKKYVGDVRKKVSNFFTGRYSGTGIDILIGLLQNGLTK